MSSQSGALGLAMLALARQRHVGISTFVSVGNKADISGNDLLQYWEGDEATRVSCSTSSRSGIRAGSRASPGRVSRIKPIVVVKPGRGRRAWRRDRTRGSRRGRRRGGRALPPDGRHPRRDAGRDVRSRLRARSSASAGGTPRRDPLGPERPGHPLRGRLRGGAAVRASALRFDQRSGSTAFLPPATTIGNPLELVRLGHGGAVRAGPSSRSSSTREVDSVIAIQTPLDADESAPMLEAIRRGTATERAAGGVGQAGPRLPRREGGGRRRRSCSRARAFPTYAYPGIGRARARKGRDVRRSGAAGPHGIIPDFDDIDPASARGTCRRAIEERGAGWLTAEEARAVLARCASPSLRRVAPRPTRPPAGPKVGFPSPSSRPRPRVFHKTEKGAVQLNVADEAAVRAHSSDSRSLRPTAAFAAKDGVLVQPMIKSDVEVKVGMFEDPSFGPLIAFGLGGIHVEVIADPSVRVTPLTDRAAAAMVRETRGYPLLEGYRGYPPADIEAIHDVLLRVSRLVEEVPDLAELELSPIFVGPPGEGCRSSTRASAWRSPRRDGPPDTRRRPAPAGTDAQVIEVRTSKEHA